MSISENIREDFEAVVKAAYRISDDVGAQVEEILRSGREAPLTNEEAVRLLTKVVALLEKNASVRNVSARSPEDVDAFVQKVVRLREQLVPDENANAPTSEGTTLLPLNGTEVSPVRPRPWFHGREVPMRSGYVKTSDIKLWSENDRLEIHLNQFRQEKGEDPRPEDLLDIMLSKMPLPGVSKADEFKIVELARSIATNGVRKPPIIDIDGSLLDGNRRLAACYYILNSNEFDSVQKKRVEHLFVWQLTDQATPDDRNAVIVSLNFEPDCKMTWPEYVRARKVFEEWESMVALELKPPGAERVRQMKRELAGRFALDMTMVTRYLKMVEWANEFEDYHIHDEQRDIYEVKHRANAVFQYFEELSKGQGAGGVAYALNQDESYKNLVFDLLFQGKFRNWSLLRKLKFQDKDVREALEKARERDDVDDAQDIVENALNAAQARRRETRVASANTRIEAFVQWFEDLPMSAFGRDIKPETVQLLWRALKKAERVVTTPNGEV